MSNDYKAYRVSWTIDIEARSPEDAAKRALEIQRDHESTATFFAVTRPDGSTVQVDLQKDRD